MSRSKNNFSYRWNQFRRKYDVKRLAIFLVALILIIFILIFIIRMIVSSTSQSVQVEETSTQQMTTQVIETTISQQEQEQQLVDAQKLAVVDGYENLGIIQVDGYLNMRDSASSTGNIIGRMYSGSACNIIELLGDWYHISSGGLDGYVHKDYMLTGEAARAIAIEEVKLRGIVTAEKLYIRSQPSTEGSIVGSGLYNERFEILAMEGDWVQVSNGYMFKEYLTIDYALDEARKYDPRSMVLNQYDNIAISIVANYLNVRDEPSEDGKIIGKMVGKSAADILETLDGWYKIRSGTVTGYVSAQYVLTGEMAKDEAVKNASLMAIVNTEVLNVREEPSDSSRIWTQITNSERYPVVKEIDGWVQIELEEDDEVYVKNEYVDVRYALNEAIKFSPDEIELANSSSRRQQIVNYALQFVGNPYVWGGTSLTNGADCSGFTLSVFKKFGVTLAHYSGTQAKTGKSVTQSQMRPGDLVFYANSSGTVNHVAIYIGNGQIVHAASRRSGIKISAWNYRRHVAIRNVLGD